MSDVQTPRERDLARTPAVLWLWGVPGGIAIGASALQSAHVISLTAAGGLWTAATAWIGVGCYLNARHCGRVHCAIDSVLFPLLSIAGLLDTAGAVSFSWNAYWIAFGLILAASFLVEMLWRRYA